MINMRLSRPVICGRLLKVKSKRRRSPSVAKLAARVYQPYLRHAGTFKSCRPMIKNTLVSVRKMTRKPTICMMPWMEKFEAPGASETAKNSFAQPAPLRSRSRVLTHNHLGLITGRIIWKKPTAKRISRRPKTRKLVF